MDGTCRGTAGRWSVSHPLSDCPATPTNCLSYISPNIWRRRELPAVSLWTGLCDIRGTGERGGESTVHTGIMQHTSFHTTLDDNDFKRWFSCIQSHMRSSHVSPSSSDLHLTHDLFRKWETSHPWIHKWHTHGWGFSHCNTTWNFWEESGLI